MKKLNLDFSGRYYCYTDMRWVGPRDNYGISSENYNQNYGTGLVPNPTRDAAGHLVRAGQTFNSVLMRIDTNGSLVVSMLAALVHVDNLGTETVLWVSNSLPLTTNAVNQFIDLDEVVTIPSDGVLILSIKPIGTFSVTRYVFAGIKVVDTREETFAETVTLVDGGSYYEVIATDGEDRKFTVLQVDKSLLTDQNNVTLPIISSKDKRE